MKKTITERLKDLNKQYKELDELKKWMNTERGHQFAKLLKVKQLDMLIRDFKAPKVSVQGYKHKLNAYVSVKHSLGIKNDISKPNPNYAKNLRKLQESGKLKLSPRLSKKELATINTEIIKDLYGRPIQKKDSKGRLLWDVKTNKPIYKTRPKNTIPCGVAAKCHAYELHKLQKWERRNPKPTEKELKSFLFPDILQKEWELRRTKAIENFRDMLSNKYCKGHVYKPEELSLYVLHKSLLPNSTPYATGDVYSFVKADPYAYGYPLVGMRVSESNSTIQNRISKITRLSSDNVGLKVIDMYGNVRASVYYDDMLRFGIAA